MSRRRIPGRRKMSRRRMTRRRMPWKLRMSFSNHFLTGHPRSWRLISILILLLMLRRCSRLWFSWPKAFASFITWSCAISILPSSGSWQIQGSDKRTLEVTSEPRAKDSGWEVTTVSGSGADGSVARLLLAPLPWMLEDTSLPYFCDNFLRWIALSFQRDWESNNCCWPNLHIGLYLYELSAKWPCSNPRSFAARTLSQDVTSHQDPMRKRHGNRKPWFCIGIALTRNFCIDIGPTWLKRSIWFVKSVLWHVWESPRPRSAATWSCSLEPRRRSTQEHHTTGW